jgi:hypothetical protein
MIGLVIFLLRLLLVRFKPKFRLEADNAALRQQVIIVQRKVHGRALLTNSNRLFFVQLYRWFPSILKAMIAVKPETLAALAPRGLPALLALEIQKIGWTPACLHRTAGFDPPDEPGEPALGCAAGPW